MSAATDLQHMQEALRLAEQGRCSTAPNPRVGCVVVRDGVVVGRGFHARAGEPHAEVFALREAGERARGATAYVTLEPCSHHGRTPPCADALIAAGVARVVYAVGDPDPRVDGRGAAQLAAAGIAVERGVGAVEATALNAGFLRRAAGGLPWVRAKVGASLDGRTALPDGRSQWITGAAARADVQWLRAEAGVIVTGIGTVLADDCRLTVRDAACVEALRGRVPLRAVLDPQARLPAAARFRDGEAPTLWLTAAAGDTEPAAPGFERLALGPGRPAPRAVLQALAARGANDVLLEAGPTLTGAWLQAGVVDELLVYLAPRLLGDLARPLAVLPAPASLDGTAAWRLHEAVAVGDDLRVTWRATD